MTRPVSTLLRAASLGDPVLDVALSTLLLDEVAAGLRTPTARIFRPRPTVAFGRRDSFEPGFEAACRAADRHGFTPVIRGPGGRAAVYDEGCLVIDEVVADDEALARIRDRFESVAERQAGVLRGLGVDARVGQVPGEYCPGAFSVNARGQAKLLGAAQRVIRGASLLSTVVVVESAQRIRPVLRDVYRALALDWEPATAGGISDEIYNVRVADVEEAMLDELAGRYDLLSGTIGARELAAVAARRARHDVSRCFSAPAR